MVLFEKTSPYVIAVYEAIKQCEKSDDIFSLAYPYGNYSSQQYLTNAANIIKKLRFEALYEIAQGRIPKQNMIYIANLSYFIANLAVIESTKEIVDDVVLEKLNDHAWTASSQFTRDDERKF